MNIGELTPDLKILIDAEIESQGGNGPGGSQTVRVIGPCSIDFGAFDTDATEIDLFDTTAGDVLIDAWFDPATVVNWDDSGPSSILFAETPPGPTVHGAQNWDFGLDQLEPGDGATQSDLIGSVTTAASDHYIGGSTTLTQQQVFAGGKYTARNRDGAGDASQGHIDLYFLVATPTAPVLTP